jgi:sporulation protein YqfD
MIIIICPPVVIILFMGIKTFLLGSARFSVECGGVVLLNRIKKFAPYNIALSGDMLCFTVSLLHVKAVKDILRREAYTVIENKNIFAFLNIFYARTVLCIAAAIVLCVLVTLGNFIFSIKISGVSTEQHGQISSYLASQNIKTLMPKSKVRAQVIAQSMISQFDFVAHAAAKIIGSTLIFNIYTVEIPIDTQVNSDIIASADGVITDIIVASGKQLVGVGDVVRKGQVLIKGEYQTGENTSLPCRAVGEVFADTSYSRMTVVGRTVQTRASTGMSKTVVDVFCTQFGRSRPAKTIPYPLFSVYRTVSKFTLFFEFTVVRTTYYEQEYITQTVDPESYKHVVAGNLATQIAAENNLDETSRVDTFFTPLSDGRIAVEVVLTNNCSIAKTVS